MPDVEIDRLVWIITGVQLTAELGDRPLAYRVEAEVRRLLGELLGQPPEGELPPLSPPVISDVHYPNSDEAQTRPLIGIGGPAVNAVAGALVNEVPTIVAIEDT